MTFNTFLQLCNQCWQEPHGFAVIDKESAMNNGQLRRGFNDFATF